MLVHHILSFSQSVHTTYETMTKLEWLVNCILLFSQSVHVMYETMTKLEWLVNCILSFSQSIHATYETMTDFSQCGARSGSPQLHHITDMDISTQTHRQKDRHKCTQTNRLTDLLFSMKLWWIIVFIIHLKQ